jgi:hypothetical protein
MILTELKESWPSLSTTEDTHLFGGSLELDFFYFISQEIIFFPENNFKKNQLLFAEFKKIFYETRG